MDTIYNYKYLIEWHTAATDTENRSEVKWRRRKRKETADVRKSAKKSSLSLSILLYENLLYRVLLTYLSLIRVGVYVRAGLCVCILIARWFNISFNFSTFIAWTDVVLIHVHQYRMCASTHERSRSHTYRMWCHSWKSCTYSRLLCDVLASI